MAGLWGNIFQSIASTANFTGQIIGANQIKAAKTAQYTPVDLQDEQAKAVSGNLANLESIEKLTSKTNTYNQGEATRLMEQAIPGWSKLQSLATQQATKLLTNPYELDNDTQEYLAKQAAERGISAGTRGQFSDFSYLKDFGISSMQAAQSRTSQAQSLMSTLASTSPRVNPMSPISMYITPQQQADEARFTNVRQQETQQAQYNAEAARNNWKWQSYMSSWAQHNAEMGAIWSSGLTGMGGTSNIVGNTGAQGSGTSMIGDFGSGFGSAMSGIA